jgi:Protein of unknown function (DUF2384)
MMFSRFSGNRSSPINQLTSRQASARSVISSYAMYLTYLKEREQMMDQEREDARTQSSRSLRQWIQLALPEARMRVATRRMPRDWFEFLTRIPIIERIVIKRFVENLMCDQWLKQPHGDLDGRDPISAATEADGRALLEGLLTRMAHNREKTSRELRRIRQRLGM